MKQARPILLRRAIGELVDPCLGKCYSEQEVYGMLQCASMCIRRDPHKRPRMSQVGNLKLIFALFKINLLSIIIFGYQATEESV